ncbi:unnamed protein product, partial [Polarella glacialis]
MRPLSPPCSQATSLRALASATSQPVGLQAPFGERQGQRRRQNATLRRPPQVPRVFLAHLSSCLGLLGLAQRRFLRACARPVRRSFRGNRLKAEQASLLGRLLEAGFTLEPVPWCADGFFHSGSEAQLRGRRSQRTVDEVAAAEEGLPEVAFGLARPHLTGEVYGQESTSMLPAEVLKAALLTPGLAGQSPGSSFRILDLCAAPGSKTTQLGDWLQTIGGLLVANEPDAARHRVLRSNLLRAGIVDCIRTRLDGRRLGDLAPEAFDAVLVDAPCSGEGNIRKASDALDAWADPDQGQRRRRAWSELQWELLQSGWRALRPGGVLVYSTCALNFEEDEAQVLRLLELGGV